MLDGEIVIMYKKYVNFLKSFSTAIDLTTVICLRKQELLIGNKYIWFKGLYRIVDNARFW
jgi:hypothetical protein